MEVTIGLLNIIKLAGKLVKHKILQHRLTTNETHVLQIEDGKIRGVKRITVYNDQFWAFEGIPYAKPPLGEIRFRAPQSVEPWDGIKDCTKNSCKPVQRNFALQLSEGSENCLFLNVYTKKFDSEKPLPVMVWIYGGGFQYGEATRDFYCPDYFMREDVVLVTISYRLGALGFLCLEDPDLQVPGNAGLKDQLLALHWVQKNIALFNGDAKNVTIFGESAGGASVHYLMLCERAEGLFHKAILQSGTTLCPWAKLSPKNLAFELASKLGYKGSNNDKEVFRFLSKIEASKLVVPDSRLLNSEEKSNFRLFAFGPVVEPYVTEDCVLVKEPLEVMRTSWSNRIPIIIGFCSFEGLFSYQTDKKLLKDLGDCTRLLPQDVRQNLNETEAREMGLRLKKAHFKEEDPSAEDSFYKLLDLFSYKYFVHGIHRTFLSRLAHASKTTGPTYLYRFDFNSPTFNHYRILTCGPSVRGACHADDLSYLFYMLISWKLSTDSLEFKTMQRMISMWTSFAANSDPNNTQISPTIWQPASRADISPKCLNISENVELIDLPELPKLTVWNSLYEKQDLI